MILDPRGESIAGHGWALRESGLAVPERLARKRPIGIDLFAGAGGFSCGMHQGGFHVAAALELDYHAAITYMVNLARPGVKIHFDTPEREAEFEELLSKSMRLDGGRRKRDGLVVDAGLVAGSGWIAGLPDDEPGCEHFWIADVRNLKGADFLDALGLQRGEVDCVFGGPPCQGFSNIGKRDVADPRNNLVYEFMRLVLEINPKTMVMENVPGILTMRTPEGALVMDVVCEQLESGGYGTFDALKKALFPEAGVRIAARGAGKSKPRASVKKRHRPKPKARGQQDLFDPEAAVDDVMDAIEEDAEEEYA